MKKLYTLIISTLFVFVLASCQQRLYFPDRANTPGLTEALEGKATITLRPQTKPTDSSSEDDINFGTSVDLAFAPMKHWGIIASYRQINNKILESGSDVFDGLDETFNGTYNGARWELGTGLFTNYGRRGKAEVYVGYGNGNLRRRNSENPNLDFNTRYHRFFIQPALGMGIDERFSVTTGFRIAMMDFYNFNATDPDLKYNIDKSKRDFTTRAHFYIEPFFNMELGYKYAKANLQFGLTKQFNDSRIGFTPYISFGLVFHFLPKFFNIQ